MKSIPIFDNREVIGHASTVKGAISVIKKMITIPRGFHLYVWRRSALMQEILDLPDGFVYSIGN